jgi:hypothetical protein
VATFKTEQEIEDNLKMYMRDKVVRMEGVWIELARENVQWRIVALMVLNPWSVN